MSSLAPIREARSFIPVMPQWPAGDPASSLSRAGSSSGTVFDVGVKAEDQALDSAKKRVVQVSCDADPLLRTLFQTALLEVSASLERRGRAEPIGDGIAPVSAVLRGVLTSCRSLAAVMAITSELHP